ncbi:MAG TPA: alpha/beta fold hydrolase [Methylomirabilota bacterium]|nr:alpha/beta fold hydrolase [Methylomirabilota bacterium]
MYYERHGRVDAGAPPVLLLHGLGSSATDWTEQLAGLGPRCRLLLVDLPGHYRSALPPGRLTVEGMAAEVGRLLDALGEPPLHVVGLSLGACVGLALALGAPARARSLTLVGGFARFRPGSAAGALALLARVACLATAPMTAVAALAARAMFPKPEQAHLYRAAVRSLARTPRRTYVAALAALAAFDARDRLARLRCPTLVVAGDRDAMVPLAAKEELARGIPGARLVVVADSGHATPADQPEAFNRVVLELVAAR